MSNGKYDKRASSTLRANKGAESPAARRKLFIPKEPAYTGEGILWARVRPFLSREILAAKGTKAISLMGSESNKRMDDEFSFLLPDGYKDILYSAIPQLYEQIVADGLVEIRTEDGFFKSPVVHHINGNPNDNRTENLQIEKYTHAKIFLGNDKGAKHTSWHMTIHPTDLHEVEDGYTVVVWKKDLQEDTYFYTPLANIGVQKLRRNKQIVVNGIASDPLAKQILHGLVEVIYTEGTKTNE